MEKIVVDGMGGDRAPQEIVKGVVDALSRKDGFKVVVTGDEERLKSEFSKYKYDKDRVEIVATTEVITNDDIPTKAIRSKKDSSLVVAFDMLKKDENTVGLVSAGSTGAVLTGGVLMIGRLKGVSRPALCPGIPNVRGGLTLLCDCGANVECKPINMAHFAIMASAYCTKVYGVKNPKIGLLSNGTEEHKGDPFHQETHKLLKQIDCINYVGNVEGRDLMYGDIDVMISDGLTGNIALKSVEGCGKTVKEVLAQSFKKNIFTKISYLFAKGSIASLKNALDYDILGGAVFLGMKKIIVKAHGTCKAKAIAPAIIQAYEAYKNDVTGTISAMLERADLDKIAVLGERDGQ